MVVDAYAPSTLVSLFPGGITGSHVAAIHTLSPEALFAPPWRASYATINFCTGTLFELLACFVTAQSPGQHMLPMGEGPFPYARELLYCSKPVRPFSWPVCPHSFNARTTFSLFFGLRHRQSLRSYCKPVVQFRLRCRSRIPLNSRTVASGRSLPFQAPGT